MAKINPLDSFGPVIQEISHSQASKVPERFLPYSKFGMTYYSSSVGDLRGRFGKVPSFAAYIPGGQVRSHTDVVLYHYTKGFGFRSIISSHELWASKLGAMNDRSEIWHTGDLFVSLVCEKLSTKAEKTRISELIAREFDEFVCAETYSISFSKRANVLSQWVKYSDHDGASIGFRKSMLGSADVGSEGWQLVDIEYRAKAQISIMNSIVSRLFMKKLSAMQDDEFSAWFRTSVGVSVSECARRFKHPGFREEEEVRLVIDTGNKPDLVCSSSANGRKYVPVSLAKLYEKSEMCDLNYEYIFSSPCECPEPKIKLMSEHLQAHGSKFVAILDSAIPYKWPS